jgi:hypothetical protein
MNLGGIMSMLMPVSNNEGPAINSLMVKPASLVIVAAIAYKKAPIAINRIAIPMPGESIGFFV